MRQKKSWGDLPPLAGLVHQKGGYKEQAVIISGGRYIRRLVDFAAEQSVKNPGGQSAKGGAVDVKRPTCQKTQKRNQCESEENAALGQGRKVKIMRIGKIWLLAK